MVGTKNMSTSFMPAKDHRNSDNSNGEKLTLSFQENTVVKDNTVNML